MYCGKCGAEIEQSAEKCNACGAPVPPPNQSPTESGAPSPRPVVYAGFWLRAAAFIIDSIILGIITLPIVAKPILSNLGSQLTAKSYIDFITGSSRQAIALQLLMNLILVLYSAAFESSAWQATPGKRLARIRVTDLSGKRISFPRAAGRNIGKVLEQVTLFVGFAMAGFTAKKQALHDMTALCLVVRGPAPRSTVSSPPR